MSNKAFKCPILIATSGNFFYSLLPRKKILTPREDQNSAAFDLTICMVTFSYRASTESLHFVEDFENNLADLLLSYSSGTLFPTSGFLNKIKIRSLYSFKDFNYSESCDSLI